MSNWGLYERIGSGNDYVSFQSGKKLEKSGKKIEIRIPRDADIGQAQNLYQFASYLVEIAGYSRKKWLLWGI